MTKRTVTIFSRRTILASGLAVSAAFLATTSRGFSQSRKRVKLAGTNLLSSAPMYVAKELGYFADEGLDVEVLESPSGNASVSSLIAGSVDAAVIGHVITWQLAEKGLKVKALVGAKMTSNYVFVMRPDIDVAFDDPKALVQIMKGKRFGVSNLGSGGDTIASGVLDEFGSKPNDFIRVAVGVGSTAIAALKSGAVDGLITYEPDLTQIVKAGSGRVVLDLRSTKAETSFSKLPTTTLQAKADWIDKNPDVAEALVKAVAKANRTLRDDPAVSIRAMTKLYPTVEPADIRTIYEGERYGFRSALPKEEFESAQALHLKVKAISKAAPYEDLTAIQFASLWI